ncbi:DUF6875 domain-containing protein [Kitasatospora sp. NPDC101155]|uniref:DUF6875 domain-containing protein n=1 Tax=Kitasatospora sp. NPDC101155 TaxID=3364097 RepID=UPI003803156F
MLGWVRDFITQPHPDLESGNPESKKVVCPFMPGSLELGLTWFALASDPIRSPVDVIDALAKYKDLIKSIPPTSGREARYKTIIVVFPMVSSEAASEFIDGVHGKVAGEYRADGLMLGEFHPGNGKCGAHNPAFFPLRSPVPAMAVRLMVARDHVFLAKDSGDPLKDLENAKAYGDAMNAMDPPPSQSPRAARGHRP